MKMNELDKFKVAIVSTVELVQLHRTEAVGQIITFGIIEVVGIAVISFIIGFGVGFLVSQQAVENGGDIRLRIAFFVTLIWAISVLATIVIPSYETSIWVHVIMGTIAGYMFGVENPITGGNINGKNK